MLQFELGPSGLVVDQQGLVLGRIGQQQRALVQVFLAVLIFQLAAQVQVVPVQLLAAWLHDLRGAGHPVIFPGLLDVAQGVVAPGFVAVQGKNQR